MIDPARRPALLAARLVCALVTASAAVTAGCGREGDEREAGPVLRVAASALGAEGDVLRAQLARFEQLHPGVRVEPYPAPDASDLQHQLYVQWLNAGVDRPDVLQLDVIWIAELAAAGWILPLDGRGVDTAAFVPAAMAASSWRGAPYALPWFVDVGMLYYRTDLVPAPPRTIEELYATAADVQRRHGLDAGLVWQGARYEGLVTVYLEHVGAFGGAIVAEGRAAVAEPPAVRALELMAGAIRSGVVPAAALGFHEEESRLWFQAGRAAFLRNWPYARALLADPARSPVAGRFAVMPMPPAPGGHSTAALGGASLAVNARSRYPDLAVELIRFLTAPEQMRERAARTGQYPGRRALYDEPALARTLGLPAADLVRLVEAATPRPVTPVYTQLSGRLQVELHRALAGQAAPPAAMRRAAAEIDGVLASARLDVLEGRAPPPGDASALPLLAGLAMLVAIALAFAVVRRRRAGALPRGAETAETTEVRLAWAFVGPALACIALVAVFPLAWTAWGSLHAHDLRLPWTGEPYVGLANYREALGDDRFWGALGHTAMFTVISVALELVLGTALALVLDRGFRGRGLVRTAVLVPWAIPTVVAALVWSFMFQPAGITDQALAWVGAGDGATAWFTRAATAWVPVILADVWKTTPFVALLLLAGLQGIDRALYEAAAVDGASRWQQLWRITLPLLRPAIAVALLFRVLDSFRVFDLLYVMTGGGPGTSTEPLAMYTFTTLLAELRFGYGAALSMLIFAGSFALAVIFVRGLGADVLRGAK